MMRRTAVLVMACAVLWSCSRSTSIRPDGAPPCRPIDSAWAVQVRVVDASVRTPVSDVDVWSFLRGAVTDSGGWACLRDLSGSPDTLRLDRRGYEPVRVVVRGATSQLVLREVEMRRVPRPCCDLRGRWHIAIVLEEPAAMYPKPEGWTVGGEVVLGPRVLPPQAGDDLDSLVRVTRGLHRVDFTPFFGGPVAPDVSRSVFGSGPDLLHEVEASGVSGDRMTMTFIPRMSHGSISFDGHVVGDTVRGTWSQNAYCCGAQGAFTMVRVGPVDTTAPPSTSGGQSPGVVRREPRGEFPRTTPGGQIPGGRWRPALAIAPDGALWLAHGGLFVADSLHGEWRRVLGGDVDPVDADELRIGNAVAFLAPRTVLLGLDERFPVEGAPVVYRSADGGARWKGVPIPDVGGVQALATYGRSVWLIPSDYAGTSARVLASDDGGLTWHSLRVPAEMRDATLLLRTSRDTTFVATDGDGGASALWHTADGGRTWAAMATPHDQGLHEVPDGYVRVQDIATVGRWLVVTEFGRVFARPLDAESGDAAQWRLLEGVSRVASEPGGHVVFALTDSCHPAFLDAELRRSWQAPQAIPSQLRDDVEDVLMRNGKGYVSFSNGNVLQASPGKGMEWLAPVPRAMESPP